MIFSRSERTLLLVVAAREGVGVDLCGIKCSGRPDATSTRNCRRWRHEQPNSLLDFHTGVHNLQRAVEDDHVPPTARSVQW